MSTKEPTRYRTECPNCKESCIHDDLTQSMLQIPHKENCRSMIVGVKTKYFIEEYID